MSGMGTYVHTPVITLHYTDVRIPYTCVLCPRAHAYACHMLVHTTTELSARAVYGRNQRYVNVRACFPFKVEETERANFERDGKS